MVNEGEGGGQNIDQGRILQMDKISTLIILMGKSIMLP